MASSMSATARLDPARRLSPFSHRAAAGVLMPFMATFSCLRCGRAWQTRGPDDLEGLVAAVAQTASARPARMAFGGWLRAGVGRASRGQPRAIGSASATGASRALPASAMDRRRGDAGLPPRRGPRRMTIGISVAAPTRMARSTTSPGRWSSTPPRSGSTRCRSRGEIVRAGCRDRLVVAVVGRQGELWCYDAVPETLDEARRRLVAAWACGRTFTSATRWAEPDRSGRWAPFCGF